jgi:hypothetical protein
MEYFYLLLFSWQEYSIWETATVLMSVKIGRGKFSTVFMSVEVPRGNSATMLKSVGYGCGKSFYHIHVG